MQQNINRQYGMTGMGWMTVLLLIGFFVMLTFNLAPTYMEHHSVKSVLQSLTEEPLITKKSKREVMSMIMKRLNTNGVRDIKRDNIKIKKSGGVMEVNIAYDVRKNIVGNVDTMISFSDSVEMVSN